MKTNIIYAKLEKEIITGYLIQFTEKPESGKIFKEGCNFVEKDYEYILEDEKGNKKKVLVKNDFEKAIELPLSLKEKIHVGFSKITNNMFVENLEEFEKSLNKGE